MGAGIGSIARTARVADVADAMNRILSNKNSAACIKTAESRPWSRICDGFLELVATHSNTTM
jgi:hypothetical protein